MLTLLAKTDPQPSQNCFAKSAAAYSMVDAILGPSKISDPAKRNLFDMALTLGLDVGLNQQDVYDRINDYSQKFGLPLPFPPQPITSGPPVQPRIKPSPPEAKTETIKKGDKIVMTDGSMYKIEAVYQGGQSVVLIVENPYLGRREVFRRKLNPDEQLLHIQTMKQVAKIRSELQKIDPDLALLALMIPEVYGIYTAKDKRQYISLEYIEGETLENKIKKKGKFSEDEEEIRKVLLGLAQLLRCLHSQGLVFRDLKPANVIIRANNGRAVLIDWDLLSQPGENLDRFGTISHVPPERIPLDKKSPSLVFPVSDTYALGIIAYEMLTGELQEDKNITGEIEERFPKIKQLSPFFQEFIDQCTRTEFFSNQGGKQYPLRPLRWTIIQALEHLQEPNKPK